MAVRVTIVDTSLPVCDVFSELLQMSSSCVRECACVGMKSKYVAGVAAQVTVLCLWRAGGASSWAGGQMGTGQAGGDSDYSWPHHEEFASGCARMLRTPLSIVMPK